MPTPYHWDRVLSPAAWATLRQVVDAGGVAQREVHCSIGARQLLEAGLVVIEEKRLVPAGEAVAVVAHFQPRRVNGRLSVDKSQDR